MSEDKESGFMEHLINWLKERLESPFVTSFIFSWILINRDFLFFIIFNDSATKSELLSSWDFTRSSDFFGLQVSGSSYIRTLLLPAAYALVFSIFINPISLVVGAIRYYLSSYAKNFAETAKEYHDNSKSFSTIKSKIEKQKYEFGETEKLHLNLKSKYFELEKKYKKESDVLEGYELSKVYGFMIEAMKIRLDPLFDKKNLVKSSVFRSNSIINFDYDFENRVLYADEFINFLIDIDKFNYALGISIGQNQLFPGKKFADTLYINSIDDIKPTQAI